MDLKSQALKINEFLLKYQDIWRDEIMNEYPESMVHYPKEWLELLDSLSMEELYAIDGKIILEKIKTTSFAHFMDEAAKLSHLNSRDIKNEIPLEDWAFNGVKKKKRHEIQTIAPELKHIQIETGFKYVVDIGGGVGHLSRILSHYHFIPSISVDRDQNFQNIGRERLKKYRRIPGSSDVEFINLTFGENTESLEYQEKIQTIFHPHAFTLGLHTCGALANHLIDYSLKKQTHGLLSFGCCYHRLDPQKDFPLSLSYKDKNFVRLNLYSFTLATRSHAQMSWDDYKTKERVKNYRYALHLFLMRHFHNKFFTDVGECPIHIYWEPFCVYIKSKLLELNLEHQFNDDDFTQFYADSNLQKELRNMFAANIIRWQIGRVLEVYLLIDRALYLEENGLKVKIEQYFNESISPRNIGILAIRKN